MPKSEPCTICDQIPPSLRANIGRGDSLPKATTALKRQKDWYGVGTTVDLWHCPQCGNCYLYSTESAFMASGNDDQDTLERLSREDSDVVCAMFTCTGDPAALEDRLFALPPIVFEEALSAAYKKDRDFIALFIPRLVLAYAKEGHGLFDFGSHPTRITLHALIEKRPTYAREVRVTAAALPPELYARLGDLEQRCRNALAIDDEPDKERAKPSHGSR